MLSDPILINSPLEANTKIKQSTAAWGGESQLLARWQSDLTLMFCQLVGTMKVRRWGQHFIDLVLPQNRPNKAMRDTAIIPYEKE